MSLVFKILPILLEISSLDSSLDDDQFPSHINMFELKYSCNFVCIFYRDRNYLHSPFQLYLVTILLFFLSRTVVVSSTWYILFKTVSQGFLAVVSFSLNFCPLRITTYANIQ